MNNKLKLSTLKMAVKILAKSSMLYFILLLFLSIISGLPSVINLKVWEEIINEIADGLKFGIDKKTIIILLCIHFAVYMMSIVSNKLIKFINDVYTTKIEMKISEDIVKFSSELTLSEIENPDTQNHLGKVGDNTTSKVSNMIDIFVEIIKNIVVFVGVVKIILSFNIWLIVLIMLSLIPIFTLNKKAVETMYQMYDETYESLRLAEYLKKTSYSYQGSRDLKIFSAFDFIIRKLGAIYNDILIKKKNVNRQNLFLTSFGDITESLATYGTKVLIIFDGIAKKHTIGYITMVFGAVDHLQNCLINFISSLLNLYDSLLYLDSYRYLQSIYEKHKISVDSSKNRYKLNSLYDIELRDVWFKYPQSEEYILKGISMYFQAGKTYEIIGLNGSGKTTLVKLILGLYSPSRGEVLINGKNISFYSLEDYCSLVSANFQDFTKLPLTIAENISMIDNSKIDKSRLERASRLGCSSNFIRKKQRKFDEIVTLGWEKSEDLSSGQWQRVNLSRTFYQDEESQIRIFDEPTSNLDLLAEYSVFNNIIEKSGDFLNIIITHRFFSVEGIDEIFVIEDGVITDHGNHEYLLRNNNMYKKLFNTHEESTKL